MADEKAAEKPKTGSVTYKQVQKAVGDSAALETWRDIGRITGAGNVPLDADNDATIATTGLSDAKLAQIDSVLKPKKEK